MKVPKILQRFFGDAKTANYEPGNASWAYIFSSTRRTPPFNLYHVQQMLADPRIQLGLRLIKGPIQDQAKFFVDCNNPELKQFLIKQISRYWMNSVITSLKAVDWGYCCSEVLYRFHGGDIQFDKLKDLHPRDCRCRVYKGKVIGAQVLNTRDVTDSTKNIELSMPKLLWNVNQREINPWYGQSRLFGAYLPWMEIWTEGSFRDSRRLFFYRNAYDGGIMYHPLGMAKLNDHDGVTFQRPNKEVAREMLEKKRNGAALTLPSLYDERGNPLWRYDPPSVPPSPQGLIEYGQELRQELLEGMGIPPEIVQAEEVGSGYAGRRIPQVAFYSTLQEIVNWTITDFDQQVLRPLAWAFASRRGMEDHDYEILPFGLLRPQGEAQRQDQEQDPQGAGGNPGSPGEESDNPKDQQKPPPAQMSSGLERAV